MLKSDAIFVKPYVKEYLINNFGEDIIIPEDNFIMAAFRVCAQRKKKMYDKRTAARKESKNFGDDMLVPVAFTLSKNTYVNHGYYLTATEEMIFRSFLEKMVKTLVDNTVDITREINPELNITDALAMFRKVGKVSEESFSEDSLRKYIYRRSKRMRTTQPKQDITLFNYGTSNNNTNSR